MANQATPGHADQSFYSVLVTIIHPHIEFMAHSSQDICLWARVVTVLASPAARASLHSSWPLLVENTTVSMFANFGLFGNPTCRECKNNEEKQTSTKTHATRGVGFLHWSTESYLQQGFFNTLPGLQRSGIMFSQRVCNGECYSYSYRKLADRSGKEVTFRDIYWWVRFFWSTVFYPT